jgi:hypothetical protein
MNKSTHFSGQPTFSQLIKLLPKEIISVCVEKHNSDRYYKKFNTFHHLVAMLFNCFGHCHSIREVVTGMRALEGRLLSCGIKHFPTRSTFADANARRDSEVFAAIYFALKNHWDSVYPDSRKHKKSTYIIDSTTIKLFQAIFKGAGQSKDNGKRKGGLKVHMAVQETQTVPSIIHLSQAASNDVTFTKHFKMPNGSTLIMDGGYRSYNQFNEWTKQNVRWITRIHPYTFYEVEESNKINKAQKKAGVQGDAVIIMGAQPKKIAKVKCRLIKFRSPESGKVFEFITNDFKSTASYIAQLYKKRWSIELLFKRLKQNMPLQYFLGDNQNAIKIQVWCALIADLLLQIVKRQVVKKWSFSNIVSIVRLHLFNYLNLFSFLENPDKSIIRTTAEDYQLKLSLSG